MGEPNVALDAEPHVHQPDWQSGDVRVNTYGLAFVSVNCVDPTCGGVGTTWLRDSPPPWWFGGKSGGRAGLPSDGEA